MRPAGPDIPEQCPPSLWQVSSAGMRKPDIAAMESRRIERIAFAVKWRAKGYTYRSIGDAMGITIDRVKQILDREILRDKEA